MKKISLNYREDIPTVKLFLEDIEELLNILIENFTKVKIILDNYEIDNLSEIQTIKKEMTTDFDISGYARDIFPEMRLSIRKKYSYLEISDKNDIKCLGIRNKILNLLNNGLNFFNFLKVNFLKVKLVTVLAIGVLFLLIMLFLKINKDDIFPISILIGFLFFIYLTLIDKII
jgi:hypothetical protein